MRPSPTLPWKACVALLVWVGVIVLVGCQGTSGNEPPPDAALAPKGAIGVGAVYAELSDRADREVLVHGVVTKVNSAIGWYWVHLRDASDDAAVADYDLTVQTKDWVSEGQRVVYRGLLRQDVDLGFGYHYDALVEEAELLP
ncbi:MAG: hypothetical protein AAF430_22965 [Myxococcota bacterium]